MNKVKFGQARIVTHDGYGDRIVNVKDLSAELSKADGEGSGVIEVSTPTGNKPSTEETAHIKRTCPNNPQCPILLETGLNNRIMLHSKGFTFQEECLPCVEERIVAATGIITFKASVPELVAEEH